MKTLTKSKYLLGIQCLKQVWMHFHEPEKVPEVDAATQKRFDEGSEVGELAKKLFSGGIDLPTEDFLGNIQLTKGALNEGKPLFEPGFLTEDGLYSRGDILVPNKDGSWDVYEVKSGCSVKDVNVEDLAFQKHVYINCGLDIRNCYLVHLNNEYYLDGELDVDKLFVKEDVSSRVDLILDEVPSKVSMIKESVDDFNVPSNKIGPHCSDPYDCPFQEECWSFLPENHVAQLYRGKSKAFELIDGEIYSLSEIPSEFKLNDKQGIQVDCDKSGKVYVDKERLKHFLNSLKYPLYYLDFETFQTAVPKFDGLKPYSQVPFQYSLHVVRSEGSEPEHYSFLYDGNGDPRSEFISSLEKVLGDSGDIIVYNQSFEISRLREIAEFLPAYSDWVESVVGRVVDLIVPFRNFSYYNPKQKGSCSLKYVLPALVGKDYSNLGITNGSDASLEYYRVAYLNGDGKSEVFKDLEEYCGLDTLGMVWIVDELNNIVGGGNK